MNMLREFKEFAVRGNVVDMAVGIIIGGAFGKIISSLVADVVMPPIGVILGGVNFSHLRITLKEAVGSGPSVTLNYGAFLQTLIDFGIVVFSVFLLVKAINAMWRKQAEAPVPPPAPSPESVLLSEIRDILKAQR